MLSSVACPAVQYFSTLSHKQYDFREKEKFTEKQNVFLFSLRLSSEAFLFLKRTDWNMIKYEYWSSRKVPRYSCQNLMKLSQQSFERYSSIKFHENPSSGMSCSMRTEGTDTMKTRLAFRNFVKSSKHETNPEFPSILTWLLSKLYEGWNFNSGNYLFTTDTK